MWTCITSAVIGPLVAFGPLGVTIWSLHLNTTEPPSRKTLAHFMFRWGEEEESFYIQLSLQGCPVPWGGKEDRFLLSYSRTLAIVEWNHGSLHLDCFFFCYKYFRKQPVFQLPSLPPCQLTLLIHLKPHIVLLLTSTTHNYSIWQVAKPPFVWTSQLKLIFPVLQCWITVLVCRLNIGPVCLGKVNHKHGVQPPQPHWPDKLLISNCMAH